MHNRAVSPTVPFHAETPYFPAQTSRRRPRCLAIRGVRAARDRVLAQGSDASPFIGTGGPLPQGSFRLWDEAFDKQFLEVLAFRGCGPLPLLFLSLARFSPSPPLLGFVPEFC